MSDGGVLNSSNAGFMGCFFAAKGATTEDPVQGLWNFVLHTWFPRNPYRINIKAKNLASNDEPDAIVIEVRFVGGRTSARESWEIRERPIFMVECKKPTRDTPEEWESARVQLLQYLDDNVAGSKRMYGAVAIGLKVEIYKWDATNPSGPLMRLHPATIDLNLAKDRRELEALLDEVKAGGWNWAEP
ncbi:hypothetical protein NKR23_g1740 [Pleurostoma richardsiae]|uniref:Uncharacterized protein n=1 Tax=Pleurostoma richardsiae TaxID=41990 RepID=A0AA38VJ08_9PEZI|nr:hypothetical protein NKR23_g1740 [Pleurostoma richardsiae]